MTVYSQVSGFFDSTKIVDTVEGFPRGDKAVDAEFLADFIATFFSDGVAKDYKGGFAVTADGSSGGVVEVGAGACLIRGRYALDKGPESIDLGFSENARTVIIAQRLDVTVAADAAITKTVITTLTDTPTNTNTVQDIWLAKVTIPAGTVNITQAMITDLRGSEVCPWIIAPLASSDWEALPTEVQDGFTRIATANGGTGDAFTATVPNFDPAADQYSKIAIRIVPAANSNANATLAVNGGTAYPLYKSDGDPCALYSLRAGIPVDVIFYQNKFFFKSAGSGAEYTKYATGEAVYTLQQVGTPISSPASMLGKFEYANLTFKPRLLFVTRVFAANVTERPNGCVCLFDAAGKIMRSISIASSSYTGNWWWDTCQGAALENGFSVQFWGGGYENNNKRATFHAYA